MKIYTRYIILLSLFLTIGCSLSNNQIVSSQTNKLPEAPPAGIEINDEIDFSDPAALVNQEETAEVINDACNVDEGCLNEVTANGIEEAQVAKTLIEEIAQIPEESIEDEEFTDLDDEEREQNLLDTALDLINASQDFWSEGNLEKAIQRLDQAYELVLKVDTESYPELIQQKEDLRFTISKRILEIYASRYTAVNGNHNEIPMIMNKHVKKEIKLFQGPERRFFMESYKRSGKYRDMIVKALKEAGLPEDLAWLPLIESGFKVKALSRARALGLWQFIPSTGYKFGLKRDTWTDARMDPEKATAGAIAYLQELHKIFGDWMTVLAGYNCGEGRVLKRIRNQKIKYLDDFWDLYRQLPRETARYVPRFLATLHILKDPEKYGFELEEPYAPLLYETVPIDKPVRLKTLAAELGIPTKELAGLNPELRHQVTPPSPYSLRVPMGMNEVLLAKLEEIPKWTPPKDAYVYHRVKNGETLSLIALRYRTSVRKIMMANNIRRKHFIRAGQKLKIPLKGSSTGRVYASAKKIPAGGNYKIRKGDSLWLIARRFNTNTKKLKRINKLRSTRLYVGQVLKVSEN